MKITSQDIEDYVYRVVIAPLKGLVIPDDYLGTNPLRVLKRQAEIAVRRRPVMERLAHNYQRREAEERSPMEIIYAEGRIRRVLGVYDRDNRMLELYYDTASEVKAVPFLNAIYELFDKGAKKYKVRIVKGVQREYLYD